MRTLTPMLKLFAGSAIVGEECASRRARDLDASAGPALLPRRRVARAARACASAATRSGRCARARSSRSATDSFIAWTCGSSENVCTCSVLLTGKPDGSGELTARLFELAAAADEVQLGLRDLCFRAIDVGDSREARFAPAARGIERSAQILQRELVDRDQQIEPEQPVVRLLDLENDVLQHAVLVEIRGEQPKLGRLQLIVAREIEEDVAQRDRRPVAIDPRRGGAGRARNGPRARCRHEAGQLRQVVRLLDPDAGGRCARRKPRLPRARIVAQRIFGELGERERRGARGLRCELGRRNLRQRLSGLPGTSRAPARPYPGRRKGRCRRNRNCWLHALGAHAMRPSATTPGPNHPSLCIVIDARDLPVSC